MTALRKTRAAPERFVVPVGHLSPEALLTACGFTDIWQRTRDMLEDGRLSTIVAAEEATFVVHTPAFAFNDETIAAYRGTRELQFGHFLYLTAHLRSVDLLRPLISSGRAVHDEKRYIGRHCVDVRDDKNGRAVELCAPQLCRLKPYWSSELSIVSLV